MIRRSLSALALVLLFSLASPSLVLAASPLFKGVDCTTAPDAAVCQDDKGTDPITGSDGALMNATNIIAYVAGAAAVIIIIVSAIRYITSGGDSGKMNSARSTLINALVGLVIIVSAKSIINFVLIKL
jgi:hypothetical protein